MVQTQADAGPSRSRSNGGIFDTLPQFTDEDFEPPEWAKTDKFKWMKDPPAEKLGESSDGGRSTGTGMGDKMRNGGVRGDDFDEKETLEGEDVDEDDEEEEEEEWKDALEEIVGVDEMGDFTTAELKVSLVPSVYQLPHIMGAMVNSPSLARAVLSSSPYKLKHPRIPEILRYREKSVEGLIECRNSSL